MARYQKIIAAIMIVLALLLGGYAWVLMQRGAKPPARAVQAPPPQPVVVAAKPLPAGVPVTVDAVRVEVLARPPANAYGRAAQVIGKVPVADLAVGEPLLATNLTEGNFGIAALLNPGERAVAVRVDEVIGVGYRINPGDRVDVFLTLKSDQREVDDSLGRLLLADLRVLAVGNRPDPEEQKKAEADAATPTAAGQAAQSAGQRTRSVSEQPPKTTVLAVPATEVDTLALAADSGRLFLALRSPREGLPDAGLNAGRPTLPGALPQGPSAFGAGTVMNPGPGMNPGAAPAAGLTGVSYTGVAASGAEAYTRSGDRGAAARAKERITLSQLSGARPKPAQTLTGLGSPALGASPTAARQQSGPARPSGPMTFSGLKRTQKGAPAPAALTPFTPASP